jgi:hypothetical protein
MREQSEPQVRQSEDARRCLHRARRSGGGEADPGPATKIRHSRKWLILSCPRMLLLSNGL